MRDARRPGFLAAALLLVAFSVPAQEAVPGSQGRERTAHPEAEDAARHIRCDCGCPTQSAWECACGHAAGMVADMDAAARSGESAEDIVNGYLEREGPAILLEPPARGWNLTAWLGPSALIVLVGLGLVILLRSWRRREPGDGEPARATGAGEDDDAYRQRALKELEGFDRGGL